MSMSQEQILAADVEAVVRGVPGVTAIFRSGTSVSKVVDAGARLLGIRDDDAPLVRVEETPEGIRVEAAIGVHGAARASETVRRAHAAIDALLAQHVTVPAEIHLTVVHIDDGPLRR